LPAEQPELPWVALPESELTVGGPENGSVIIGVGMLPVAQWPALL